MSQVLTPDQRETLRHAVLEFLASRPAVAFPADVITRRLNASKLYDFTVVDTQTIDALQLLRGLELVTVRVDGLGSTNFYQATSAGVLAFERGI